MEKQYKAKHYILKNPSFVGDIEKIVKDKKKYNNKNSYYTIT